jgi:hypothetical protein
LARSVAESARSRHARFDTERLFEIQPCLTQMPMYLLPTVRIGKSQLIEREVLAGLLDRLAVAKALGQG